MPFPIRFPVPALLCASLVLVDCASNRSTVKIPATDSSPPFVALDAVGAGHSLVLSVGRGSEKVELLPRDSLILIGLGEDADGGLKDIILTGNAVVTCKDMSTGKTRTRTTGFLRKTVSGSPRITHGPMRRTNRFVLRTGDLAALCRGPGQAYAGAVGQASVRTVNFHGGHATSPSLEFRSLGGWVPLDAPTAGVPAQSGKRRETPVAASAMVTPDIPAPVGFMPEGGIGGSGFCPKDAFPPSPDCEDAPIPFLRKNRGDAEPRDELRGAVPPQTIPKS